MALTYAQVKSLVDMTWTDRVEGAMEAAAIAISVDAPVSPLDARRDRLARQVLHDPRRWATLFALPVALGFLAGADLTSVTDAQIDTRVSSIWNDFLE